jgi:hypothetical protein
VSEEQKSVGLVHAGHLFSDIDHATIRKMLYEMYHLRLKPTERGGA